MKLTAEQEKRVNDFFDSLTTEELDFLVEKYLHKPIKKEVDSGNTNVEGVTMKMKFSDWKYSKGMRYLSGHTYKDNDGDLYDSDELEKMYQNYISL